jgi:hypothetical protein
MSEKPVESVEAVEAQPVHSEVNDTGNTVVAEEQEGT